MELKKLIRCYTIHSKTSPFKVCNYSNETISIFINQFHSNDEESNDSESDYQKFWRSFPYDNIWIAKEKNQSYTILINTETKNKQHYYVLITDRIIMFALKVCIIGLKTNCKNGLCAYTEDSFITFHPDIQEIAMSEKDKTNIGKDRILPGKEVKKIYTGHWGKKMIGSVDDNIILTKILHDGNEIKNKRRTNKSKSRISVSKSKPTRSKSKSRRTTRSK